MTQTANPAHFHTDIYPRLASLSSDRQAGDVESKRLSLKTQIVIPARLASTRLPEKLLLRETGKTVLQHTYEEAQAARHPLGTIIAVDSERLQSEVQAFGGQSILTDPELPSGTDRVAVVARHSPHVDAFINVQGDEPEISGHAIDLVAELLEQHPDADVATLAAPIRMRERLDDPSCVKVVAITAAMPCTSAAQLYLTPVPGTINISAAIHRRFCSTWEFMAIDATFAAVGRASAQPARTVGTLGTAAISASWMQDRSPGS